MLLFIEKDIFVNVQNLIEDKQIVKKTSCEEVRERYKIYNFRQFCF